jgi:demethylmenaquinone methyltransferase/2-methoxy-6-polyprenyl-1,4-benzoquinol methylase
MDDNVLKEQLDYYNARAGEYDESLQDIGGSSTTQSGFEEANQEWQRIVTALHTLNPVDEVLELACGTGIWTRELMSISRSLTAIDGSAEMIEINRAKTDDAAIQYQRLDLFQWEPDQQYDLVFFAFWLSHIPPSRLSEFHE